MPTISQLLADHPDLTSGQRLDMQIAYDESPEGFERVAVEAASMKRPTGYLVAMIRSSAHIEVTQPKRPKATLSVVLDEAVRLYVSRLEEYPAIDEKGWRFDDAIAYAVDTAQFFHRGFTSDEIERGVRRRLSIPWDGGSDPAHGVECPSELRSRIRVRSRQVGLLRLPDDDDGTKVPSEEPEESLAEALARARSDT